MRAVVPWVVGSAWGVVAAFPLAARGRRAALAARVAPLASDAGRPRRRWQHTLEVRTRPLVERAGVSAVAAPIRRVVGGFLRLRASRRRDAALARELPVVLDLLGVAVGAGCTPYLAVEVAVRWAPPVVAARLTSVIQACTLGVAFEVALDDLARAVPLLRPLADALLASERLGAPVGRALARLSAEERASLRRRAESHDRKVPVRLLFPLVFLVLPAFVLLTVVPGLAAGLGRL